MLNPSQLGQKAAEVKKMRGRCGRRVKGESMSKHLHAAGSAKMNKKEVFAFPRGHRVGKQKD